MPSSATAWLAGALAWGAVCCFALAARGGEAAPLTLRVVSPRAGLLFTDSEPVDVRARVAGGPGPTTVSYTVAESGGPWMAKGTLAFPAAGGEKRLPLDLPGRGLYKLTLAATSGDAKAQAETWVAVVFTPPEPDPASPWGIFYTPHIWFNKGNANGARDAALSHRLLGASWSRLNFWAHSFEKVALAGGKVKAEYPMWKSYARALRDQGISIFGEIAQCPRELSSRPDDTAVVGDAGPVWCRVKPRDYALWEQLIENLARDFRREIQVWEIWNEPNLPNRYWTGTLEDFATHIEHTSRAFRRGNPEARIAAGGFVHDIAFADRLFQLGMGRHIDILSVHYTDDRPDEIGRWRNLLAKHELELPIWNSEESSAIPLRNLASPIERSFKFIHVQIGYDSYRPLVRKDLTVLPAGIAFSVGAHCIGSAKCIGATDAVPGYDVLFFQRGEEVVGAFDRNQQTGSTRLFGPSALAATLVAEPLDGRKPAVTDTWGRSRPLEIRNGRASLPLADATVFVNGCRRLEVVESVAGAPTRIPVVEAESGRWSAGWSANAKAGFSGGRILELWKKEEPDAAGYWAQLTFRVPAAGRYELLFSGNSPARLAPPPSISPFVWRIDDRKPVAPHAALPVQQGVPGAPEGLSTLGTVDLKAGDHTFRLTLTGRRKQYDTCYAMWFDAIALRAVPEGD